MTSLPLFTRQVDDPAAHTPTIYDAHASVVNEMMDELEPIAASTMSPRYTNVAALAGTLTLTDADLPLQSLDANGANRDVQLPAVADTNHLFAITNRTAATYVINIKTAGGAALVTVVNPGATVIVLPDGVNGWYADARIVETGGPTALTVGAIPDGQGLVRSGTSIVGTILGQVLYETGGPTVLAVGAIADGQTVRRSGAAIVGRLDASLVTANDYSKTSDIVFTTITGMSVSLPAAGTYRFQARLFIACGVTGGAKYRINSTATISNIIFEIVGYDTGTPAVFLTPTQTANNGSGSKAGITEMVIDIEGTITTTGAGSFNVQFAQQVSNGTASTVKAGSYLDVWAA